MKIQIDTDNKTITINEDVLFKTLMAELDKLFPNKSWEHFKLLTTPIVNWSNPIIIEPVYPPLYPTSPIYPTYPMFPWVIEGVCTDDEITTNGTINYNSGTYNVETK